MPTAKGVLAYIDKYNALAVADQTVAQALSILYEPAAPGVVSSCLSGAGCRESPLRAFSPQIVAVRLARLGKAGLVQDCIAEARGQKIRLWRCRPEVAEIATRHAVRDGHFIPMAKAALVETRGRDWRGEGADDSPRRRLRLAFHGGDWRTAAEALGEMSRREPGEGGLFLAGILRLQPDDTWRRNLDDPALRACLAITLRDLAAGLAAPHPVDQLARELVGADDKGTELDDLALALAETACLRGKFREAAKIGELAPGDETRFTVLMMAAAMEERPEARDLMETAVARRKARLGGRDQLLAESGAVWQTLAVLEADDPEATDAMLRRLASPAAFSHRQAGALSCLRHVLLFMAGQAFAARSLTSAPPDPHPLARLVHALSLLRVDPGRLGGIAPDLDALAAKAKTGGYRWLASQLRCAAAAATDREAADADAHPWPILARLFRGDDEWRRSLKALAGLTAEEEGSEPVPQKRLAWLVLFPPHPPDPFCPVTVQPVEQTRGRDGQWSKGRNVALRRIFQRQTDLGFATDQDRMVFSALRFDYAGGGYSFDIAAALPRLIGHPHVFRGDAGGAKIEVVPGQFELSVTANRGGCEIFMEPPLSDFAPPESGGGTAPDRAVGQPPETAARLETPTRLRIYRLGEHERRLARIVGDGLSIPPQGMAEAIRILGGLAGRTRMHSDIPELAGGGELVEADSRPRFHIMPQNPGLKVEVWAHPLGDDGPAYRPGRGGRLLVAAVGDRELRTARSPARERELAREAVEACPALAGGLEGDLSWRLDNPGDALEFLSQTEDLGDKAVLVWPKGGRFRVRKVRGAGGLALRVSSSAEWFDVDGGLTVDENLVIGMAELMAAVRASRGRFIAIGNGDYLALTDELRRQLGDLETLGEMHGDSLRLPALAGAALEGIEDSGASLKADAEWRLRLERRRDLAEFAPDPPAGFRAELRPYQLEGYQWLARLAEWGAGACLADDMGLGKTVQALALMVRRAENGPSLVVAPTSVCHNWLSEAKRFAPALAMRQFGDGDRHAHLASLGPRDAVIASYSLLRQEETLFSGVAWATVVLDEAQAIKNIAAKRSRAAMALDAGFRVITTGTPIENHLGELWNLFRFINPRLLGSWRRFQERFANPIGRQGDIEARERLRRLIRPFILRRTKAQVLDSLPPKTEITLSVDLGEKERAFYESLRRSALERLESDPSVAEKKRFQILAEIMRLRRACCSPELITGDASIPSAKQEQFRRTLGDLVENGHKVLVFSQFVDHLSILRRHLEREGRPYQYLDGATPAKGRKKAVEDFQAGIGDAFLISLKAGGLGLNLTAADYVIHMDPWWNPAVEDQASDRAHRIGQDKPVTVYRLVASGTIEEKIVDLHRDKRDLADSLLSGADQAARLDMDEIMRLLRQD